MTTTTSFTTDVRPAPIHELFERVRQFVIEHNQRRVRRAALVGLLQMSPERLDDLGIGIHDVIEALDHSTPGRTLEARRAANAAPNL